MRRARSGRVRAVALMAAVLASCSGPDPEPTPRVPPIASERLDGQILLAADEEGLFLAELTSDGEVPLGETRVPQAHVIDAVPEAGGTALALVERPGEAQLFRVGPGREPQRVGPALRVLPARQAPLFFSPFSIRSFAVIEGRAVVSACGFPSQTLGLSLHAPTRWTVLAEGCPAAPGPRGWMYVAEDTEILRRGVGLPPREQRVLDLQEVPELGAAGILAPEVEEMAAEDERLAVLVQDASEDRDRSALVILERDRVTDVVALGASDPSSLTWQPGGDDVAFTDCVDCGGRFFVSTFRDPQGEVRVYDVSTGSMRQLVASTEPVAGLAWAPDGGSLVTAWRPGELAFLTPEDGMIARAKVEPGWAPRRWIARPA